MPRERLTGAGTAVAVFLSGAVLLGLEITASRILAPSVVLATASPIAVRLAARSFERLGRTAGRLFAISTAGSIAGRS